jgi:hypothetical protein
MPVTFDNTFVNDYGKPTDVETLFKVYGNWGGVHHFKFFNLVQMASIDTSGTDWSGIIALDAYVKDALLEYSVTARGHGAIFRYVDGDGLLVGIDTSSNFVVYNLVAGVKTLLCSRPVVVPVAGAVRIAYRMQRFSSDEADLWETVTMWLGDAQIGTFARYLGATVDVATQVALVAQTSLTFTNVRVPQLTAFSEWASIDPGEAPIGGLERSIEGRYVKYFMRHTGELKAWRGRPTDAVYEYSDTEEVYIGERNFDPRQLYTHVRMLGAFTQAEFVRGDIISEREHRFIEVNNPYIMSEDECYIEAEKEIVRQEETALIENIEAPFRPALEPEDHIITADGHRIISRREWDFTQTTITEALQLRKYAYYVEDEEPDEGVD